MYYDSAPFTSQTAITPNVNPDSSIAYPHVPICTHCPPPSITVSEPALTVKDLVEALRSNRKGPLPEWTLSKYDGDPLLWHEWSGQFKSAIDSADLTDDEKLTYLKTLVVGKAKLAIADVAYSGRFYRDIFQTLEWKFGQPK